MTVQVKNKIVMAAESLVEACKEAGNSEMDRGHEQKHRISKKSNHVTFSEIWQRCVERKRTKVGLIQLTLDRAGAIPREAQV